MHFTTLGPTFVLCDNLGAVHTAANPVSSYSKRSKYIDIRFLKIREYQEQQRLVIKHIDGNKNVADMFTKPLAAPALKSTVSLSILVVRRRRCSRNGHLKNRMAALCSSDSAPMRAAMQKTRFIHLLYT